MKRTTLLCFAAIALLAACRKNVQENAPVLIDEKQSAPEMMASAALNSWMSDLPDNVSLAQLSIPGTHDAGARFEPVSGTAKCQNLTIAQQLDAGIRFLDVRCRHIDNAFTIHHGAIYQNLNFQDVLNACTAFLNAHPGETIVMCVKEEHNPENVSRTFEQTFDSYVQQDPGRWRLAASVPTLGDARGKIVLLRRFGASSTPKGIAATSWADNTTFSINTPDANLRVQDQYVVPDNNAKWNRITDLFTEANGSSGNTLYINFTSGYRSLIFGIPSITTVSNNINPRITTYFTSNTSGHYGIIPMDFADAGKAQLIVDTNF